MAPNLRATWLTPWDFSVAATWRHFGKVSLDNNDSQSLLQDSTFGAPNTFNAKIAAYNWLDLAATWDFMENVKLRGGINNVFDKAPPLVTSEQISGGGANTYEIYDLFGRQVFASISVKF